MGKKLDEEIQHLKETTTPIQTPRLRGIKYSDENSVENSKLRRGATFKKEQDKLERIRMRNADLFDDPKSESEEEPLHELTDGELKEVEKLKAWEVWLEKAMGKDSDHIRAPMFREEGKAPHEMSTKPTGTTVRGRFGNKLTETPKKESVRGAKTTQTGRSVSQHLKPESVKHLPKDIELQYLKDPEHEHEGAGSTRKIPKTQKELDEDFFQQEADEYKKGRKKSWESWLEKAKEVKLTKEGKKILEEAKRYASLNMYKSWLEKRKIPKKDRPESPNKENNYQTQLDKPIQWRALKEKSWESWLEKRDKPKIKPANWEPNNEDEKPENWTQMKPEDFSDVATAEAGNDAHKIPKRPVQYTPDGGKTTKYRTSKRGTVNTKQEKQPYTADAVKLGRENDINYNHRGDELGRIEHYQRKLRHGEPIKAPSLGVRGGGKGKTRQVKGHEGRHRAEAAAREGLKTIPVGIGSSALRAGGEKKLTPRQVKNLRGERSALGTSERAIRENVKEGIEALKSWEIWLEKKKDQGQGDARYGNPHETGMEDPRILQTSRDDFSLEDTKEEGNKPYIERKPESDKDEQS